MRIGTVPLSVIARHPRRSLSPRDYLSEQDDVCHARGCGHTRREHRTGDSPYCRRCFDTHPSDDSMIEGGVYHAFDEGVN